MLAAGFGLSSLPLSKVVDAKKRVAASDKIRVALIGGNNMGWVNLQEHIALPEVDCIAICDVDESVMNKRAAEVEQLTGKKPALYTDFRKLLENKDVDAVIIGTPDHWHCLQMVYACQAGKDVYVEKPMAKTIEECNVMMAAAKRYGRVVQVGQWQRSGPHWQSAINYVHSGKLGKIRHVKTWLYYDTSRILLPQPDTAPPPGVHYDLWLGPATKREFNPNRFHRSWRYFWDYGGGVMTDWGVHLLDMAFHGMKSNYAKSVMSAGGKYTSPESAAETPDNQFATYEFDNYAVTWEHVIGASPGLYGGNYCGVAFIGANGTLVVDREKWRLFPEVSKGEYVLPAVPEQRGGSKDLTLHVRNFIDCMKTRARPNCDAEIARNVAVNSIVSNLSLRLGRKLSWDNAANSFKGDKEANQLVKPVYREPWSLPKMA
jgi:predicted dehydrogenase